MAVRWGTFNLPWNTKGFIVGPDENANVHTASACLSLYGYNNLFKPSFPNDSRKYFL